MAEEFNKSGSKNRDSQYQSLLPQISALVQGEPDLIANLSNIAAAIREEFGFLWVGFYIEKDGVLVLGPFQGPIACTRISPTKGVCGAAYSSKSTVIVPNVDEFPGHIACSSLSKSEIVVPIKNPNGSVAMVLDLDSQELNGFSEVDGRHLESLAAIIEGLI